MAFRDSINDLMYRFYERFKQNNNRLPVSVDADINVGDVQIGTVKQGGVDEGAEPWKVKAEELEQKIDALKQSIESGVQLKVSVPTHQGLSTDAKPPLDSADRAWFYEQDTGKLYYWDGSKWVVSD